MHQPKLSFSKCSDLDKSSLLELKKNSLISDQDQIWVAYLTAYSKWARIHFLKEFMIFWHNILELEHVWFTLDIQWLYDVAIFVHTQDLYTIATWVHSCLLCFSHFCGPSTPSGLRGSTIWDQPLSCFRNSECFPLASAMQPGDQPFAWCFWLFLHWIRMDHHSTEWDEASS